MQINKRNTVGRPLMSATSAMLTATFLISVHISLKGNLVQIYFFI